MAYITFYDTTEIDKTQLNEALNGTDHHWEFEDSSISADNLHPDSEVISVFVTSTVSRELIEKLPKLKLIACRSTGFDNIDVAAARERGITVVNVPSYGEHTVAEYAFTLILALSRKLREAIQAVDDADVALGQITGFDLRDKTIGIVGMGRIGQSTGQIARGFGMRVIAYDPFPNEQRAAEIGYEYVPLEEIAKQSDVVSIHAPYTRENHHIVGTDFFGQMKPSAILVNTARGELVDTKALITALTQGNLAGAALDVVEGEHLLKVENELPLLNQRTKSDLMQAAMQLDVLKKLPNLILTPHNAFNTAEAVGRINQTTADNITGFWTGDIPHKVELPPVGRGKVILVRHGESEWNVLGKWTGTTDVHLTEKGFREAAMLGQELEDTPIDYAYCSQQIRALETLEGILDASRQFDVQFERSSAINERDYGDYTGMNKWEMRDKVGEDEFNAIRRNWDHHVPNGETLKMVYERAVPFYQENVLPKIREGKNVLLVAHGNSIRALTKYIEDISDEGIADIEMPFGKVVMYEVTEDGKMTNKEERKIDTVAPHA